MSTSTNEWTDIAPLRTDNLEIVNSAARLIAIRGELSMRDPVSELSPYLRNIHERALGGGDVVVDLTALTFVNSSGLRVFLDWIAWISAESPELRYRLVFRTNPKFIWQAASLGPMAILGGDYVHLQSA